MGNPAQTLKDALEAKQRKRNTKGAIGRQQSARGNAKRVAADQPRKKRYALQIRLAA
jgi:hypothetical protein